MQQTSAQRHQCSNKLELVEHNTCIILKCDQGWLQVSALQEAIIRTFVGEQFNQV
jgi:hypothetical protein